MTLQDRNPNAPIAWKGELPVTNRYTYGIAGVGRHSDGVAVRSIITGADHHELPGVRQMFNSNAQGAQVAAFLRRAAPRVAGQVRPAGGDSIYLRVTIQREGGEQELHAAQVVAGVAQVAR